MSSYVDTSVLVAYYLPEPLSAATDRLLRSLPSPALSDLVEVEMQSAIARKVRTGELEATDAARARALFSAHLEAGHFARLALDRAIYRLAADWIRQLPVPLRSLDSLHLALAFSRGLRLVTADQGMARAARAAYVECLLLTPEDPARVTESGGAENATREVAADPSEAGE